MRLKTRAELERAPAWMGFDLILARTVSPASGRPPASVDNQRKPWSPGDERDLIGLALQGHTARTIAEMVKRSPDAVRSRLEKLRREGKM
jgi:hypothetical protein